MRVCMDAKSRHGLSLSITFHLIVLRQDLSLSLTGWLASQRAPGCLLPLLPSAEIRGTIFHAWIICIGDLISREFYHLTSLVQKHLSYIPFFQSSRLAAQGTVCSFILSILSLPGMAMSDTEDKKQVVGRETEVWIVNGKWFHLSSI